MTRVAQAAANPDKDCAGRRLAVEAGIQNLTLKLATERAAAAAKGGSRGTGTASQGAEMSCSLWQDRVFVAGKLLDGDDLSCQNMSFQT